VRTYSLSHLSDAAVMSNVPAVMARKRGATAELLAYIAEIDARRLFVAAGYSSIHAYGMEALGMTEDAVYKRITAARTARQFPAILPMLADGRLHVTAVLILAPHLIPENADSLLRAAAGKSKPEVEKLLAERFTRSEVMPLVERLVSSDGSPLAPERVEKSELVEELSRQLAPERVEAGAARTQVAAIATDRYAYHVSVSQAPHDKICESQALLGHEIPKRGGPVRADCRCAARGAGPTGPVLLREASARPGGVTGGSMSASRWWRLPAPTDLAGASWLSTERVDLSPAHPADGSSCPPEVRRRSRVP
jgi:hypothetical protein